MDRQIHVCEYGVFETDRPDVVGEETAIERGIQDLTSEIYEAYPELHCGLVDAGHWGEVVRPCVSGLPDFWHPSHGLPNYKHPLESKDGKVELPASESELWHWSLVQGVWVVNFNPDAIKHRVHAGFLIRPMGQSGPVSGSVTLWGSEPTEHTQFAREVVAEQFRREFVPGKGIKESWEKVYKRNHYLDTSCGNNLARLVLKHWDAEQSGYNSDWDLNPSRKVDFTDPSVSTIFCRND